MSQLSEWHRRVLRGLRTGKVVSNSMDTYINLRFDGYVHVDGDGAISLTEKGWRESEGRNSEPR